MENSELLKTRNPMEYLKIFFRRKWLFIAPVFVGLVLSIVACFMLPPRYESSTMILVEEEKIINPLIDKLAISSTAAQRMENIKEVILGWNSMAELAKKLNLANDTQNQPQLEALIKSLRDSINVRMRQSNIIQITYTANNPKETQLGAKSLTEILMERNLAAQTRETDVAIKFIQEQLQIYKRKIKESEIADLEDQLKKLLIDSTEMHPMVRELRQRISVAKKELDSGDYEIASPGEPLAEATRKAFKKELDNIIAKETRPASDYVAFAQDTEAVPNEGIYKLALMDKIGTSMAQDIDVNKRIYQMLLERLETAKITQRLEASKEGTRYTIIEPPRLPLRPTKPNKMKVIFLGIIFGGFTGTGLVFGKEFMDHSFLDIEDAKNNLALPVLGAISRITTLEEIEGHKNKEKQLIKITLITSLVMILMAMAVSFLRR